ncbi:MAG: hypothetical protein ACOZCO_15515 [Bacteroidota bacterium]
METVDQSNNSFPEEAVKEIRSMYGWMLFVAIMGIIGGGFGVLGAFGTLAQQPLQGLINLITNGVGLYAAIMLMQSASAFNKFVAARDAQSLTTAMSKVQLYFLITCIMIFVSIILGIVGGLAGALMMK